MTQTDPNFPVDDKFKPGALIYYRNALYEVKRKRTGYVDVVDWKTEQWHELKTWQVMRARLVRKADGEWVARDSLSLNAES